MDAARRRRLSRLATALPTTALLVVALAAAVVSDDRSQRSGARPVANPVPYTKYSPTGQVATQDQYRGGYYRMTGWAFDTGGPSSTISVLARVDGTLAKTAVANIPVANVGKKYPAAGSKHGFRIYVPVTEGSHRVCLSARNLGKGNDTVLGCITRTFDFGPFGAFSVKNALGALRITGWTMDADKAAAPVSTTIRVDGNRQTIVANRYRADTAAMRPGAGSAHGFDVTVKASQGKHTVCVSGRNIGVGADNRIGCKDVVLDNGPVVGLDYARQYDGTLQVRGWAFDWDRPTAALPVTVTVDSKSTRRLTASGTRSDVAKAHPSAGAKHGFDTAFTLAEGKHTVCVSVGNLGYGATRTLPCRSVTLDFTPDAGLTALTPQTTGFSVAGWTSDPDTTKPISAHITLDGRTVDTVTANGKGTTHTGHNFSARVPAKSGTHTVCAVGVNVLHGRSNSTPACRTITLALKPLGRFESVARSGETDLVVTGWAFDPDTTSALSLTATVDGKPASGGRTGVARPDVDRAYRAAGPKQGFRFAIPADDGKHTVCLTAVQGGDATSLGCRLIIAAHPTAPSAPRTVKATSGYGASTVTWTAPISDGGAPWTKYLVTASPGGRSVAVAANATRVTLTGLATRTTYTFSVRAVNVAGTSVAGLSPRVTTQAGPAPQTTPAPVSTSRYIRNIRTCSTSEKAWIYRAGAVDAKNNPAGHKYLQLLDIGGQSQTYGGVVLSATTRFVTYSALLLCSKSYVAGYHSAQKSGAPALIAIGVNNDMDVNTQTGRDWANKIVDPLVAYARGFSGITIAGANDIEPGFSASYTATKNWLAGYLSSTTAKFVFNGSADGCAWTVTDRRCNNGWSMAGLYNLAAGAAPGRILNLPQVYNYTMADQWKYISLTGVGAGKPRIIFGGPLTEVTACAQARSCGSISGVSAWKRMWSNLQSHSKLKVGSLPYATDLRIDR